MKNLARGVTAQRGVLNVVTSGLQSGRLVLSPLSAPPVAARTRIGNKQARTKGKETAMAKLPYTITICPDGPEPAKFTASCREMGELLKNSPDGDLTINNRVVWDSWTNRPLQPAPIEDMLRAMVKPEKNT